MNVLFEDLALRGRRRTWYEQAALDALLIGGNYHPIPTRAGDDLYLLRIWLSPPRLAAAPSDAAGCLWESGNSVLLHYFAVPDDDGSLHDHPWDFATHIIAGGYREALRPAGWDQPVGPPIDSYFVDRRRGEFVDHQAEDLHSVVIVAPGTWTIVTTGPRRRAWGFHPPGEPWVDAPTFLDRRRPASVA